MNTTVTAETPLISIIIPTYNRAHLIGETLDSVLAQSYQNWECIVVDDGSTDGTDEVMSGYMAKDCRFQYHHRPKDRLKGGNAARNYGFEKSKGEYVNWFDSDDLMLEDFLQSAIESILKEQVDFVLFDYKVFNQETGKFFVVQKNKTDNLIEDYVTFKINFGTWAIIWNRDLISNFRFNEKLTKAQDLDFNFRVLTSTKYNYVTSNEFGLLIRGHANSIVQDYKKNNLKSITSELYARKQVLIYMLNKRADINVKNKCFELYVEPFLKILRQRKLFFIFKELCSLVLVNTKMFLSNLVWFFKASFYLFFILVFNKGEYKLKHILLKYKYS